MTTYLQAQEQAQEVLSYWERLDYSPDFPNYAVDVIANKLQEGLDVPMAIHCVDVAMRSNVPDNRVWRYFLGCCNRRMEEVTQ